MVEAELRAAANALLELADLSAEYEGLQNSVSSLMESLATPGEREVARIYEQPNHAGQIPSTEPIEFAQQ